MKRLVYILDPELNGKCYFGKVEVVDGKFFCEGKFYNYPNKEDINKFFLLRRFIFTYKVPLYSTKFADPISCNILVRDLKSMVVV